MSTRNPSLFWGVVLVVLGVLFLLANTGVLDRINWDFVWPLALIAVGVWLIARRVGWEGRRANPPPAPSEPRTEPHTEPPAEPHTEPPAEPPRPTS